MIATMVVLPAMIRLLRMLMVKFSVIRTVLKFSSVHWMGQILVGLFSISLLLLKAETNSHSSGNTAMMDSRIK